MAGTWNVGCVTRNAKAYGKETLTRLGRQRSPSLQRWAIPNRNMCRCLTTRLYQTVYMPAGRPRTVITNSPLHRQVRTPHCRPMYLTPSCCREVACLLYRVTAARRYRRSLQRGNMSMAPPPFGRMGTASLVPRVSTRLTGTGKQRRGEISPEGVWQVRIVQ